MTACPSCSNDVPGEFSFCPHCGAALAVPSVRAARQRKVVSVLFCDLVGFTAAAESADPEEVAARVAPYHAAVRDRIEAFGGTVEKFIGDAVMAVFGAPVAHEDDAERAVRAGLALLETIEELNDRATSPALSVRVGVNTGEAVVALEARPELGEGIVTGDVVNTAARIQAYGPVDGVAVGETTFRATERVFEYEPLEPIVAKGKAVPVPVWRAVAARARFGSDVIRSMTTRLPHWPMPEAGVAAARANVTEARGDPALAAERYSAVADSWRSLGARLEEGYAVLGLGRCLAALGDPSAEATLREARRLFAAMGAHARVEDCDVLLAQASRLSS